MAKQESKWEHLRDHSSKPELKDPSVGFSALKSSLKLIGSLFNSKQKDGSNTVSVVDPEKAQKVTLIREFFPDASYPIATFLSSKDLRALAPLSDFKSRLTSEYDFSEFFDYRINNLEHNQSNKLLDKSRKLEDLGDRLIESYQSEPSLFIYAAIDQVREVAEGVLSDVKFRKDKFTDYKVLEIVKEIEQSLEKFKDRLITLLANDSSCYGVELLAISPVKDILRDFTSTSGTFHVGLERFMESVNPEQISEFNFRKIKRILSFVNYLASIEEIDESRDRLNDSRKISGEDIAYEILFSILKEDLNREILFHHPKIRPLLIPLAERAYQQYLNEATYDPILVAKDREQVSFYRTSFLEAFMRDEREVLRQEALTAGVHWGTLRVLSKGWGRDSLNEVTAHLVGRSLAQLSEIFYDQVCQLDQFDQTISDYNFDRNFINVSESRGLFNESTRGLHQVSEVINRLLSGSFGHHRCITESFLAGCSDKAFYVWQRLAGGEPWKGFGAEDSPAIYMSKFGFPNELVCTYLGKNQPDRAKQPISRLLNKFSQAEVTHLLSICDNELNRLEIISTETPMRNGLYDPVFNETEILNTSSLANLVGRLRAPLVARVRKELKQFTSRMRHMVSELDSNQDYCDSRISASRRNILRMCKKALVGNSKIDPKQILNLIKQDRFARINSGLFDLEQMIPPTTKEVISISSPKDELLKLYSRGILNPLSPSTNGERESDDRLRSMQDRIVSAAAKKLDIKGAEFLEISQEINSSILRRERFYNLISDPDFESEVLKPILNEYGVSTPSISISILPKSDPRNWLKYYVDRSDCSLLAIEYRSNNTKENSLVQLWLGEDSSLIIQGLFLPKSLRTLAFETRNAVLDFLVRYSDNQIPILIDGHTIPSVSRIVLGTTYHGVPIGDLATCDQSNPIGDRPDNAGRWPESTYFNDSLPKLLWAKN